MFVTYEFVIIVILTVLFIVLSLSPLLENRENEVRAVSQRAKRQKPTFNHVDSRKNVAIESREQEGKKSIVTL